MDVGTARPTIGKISADEALTSLENVQAQVEEDPINVPLLRQQICLMRLLDMRGEVSGSLSRMASLIMLNEGARWYSNIHG